MDMLATAADPLARATWGLLTATALLVVATAIPAWQNWQATRRAKAAAAAALVPDMNIAHSRIARRVNRLLNLTKMSTSELQLLQENIQEDLNIVSRSVELSYGVSLKFANEMYIVRHLLTQAYNEVLALLAGVEETSVDDAGAHRRLVTATHEQRLSRVCALYQAADATLLAGESLLPAATRTVDGQSFWDRFSSVAQEREAEAEKVLVDRRRAARTAR
jgi:hypothetical protein